ncbi:hypothetical protein CHU98_g8452 [Xylaria longipes]|nr:hypothetical protein CHU98_g8452 [Xylaria longipes]
MVDAISEVQLYTDKNVNSLSLAVWMAPDDRYGGRERVISRQPIISNEAQEYASLIDVWLQRCLRYHTQCSIRHHVEEMKLSKIIGEVVDLPIRILCIGGDEEPRIKLVESISLRGRYCTLSHRWGSQNKHPIQTTKANSSEYFIDIKFDSLPKVYQEAVTIARRLGFDYLWIDCLCIVQDDEEDWCREAEDVGFHYSLHLPSNLSLQDSPLGQRAWAFQEWHLSRRRVFFTPKGMFWSCRENNLLNERDCPVPFGLKLVQSIGQGIFGPWTQILAAYTRKKLTRMSDRLVALWGIATKYRETKKARYIAGIWEDDIAAQLLWQATKEPKPAENFNGVPSWSWAATGNENHWVFQDEKKATSSPLPLYTHLQIAADGRLNITTRLAKVDCGLNEMKSLSCRKPI